MRYDYDPSDPDAPQPMDLDASDDDFADEEDESPNECAGCGRPLHPLAAVCPHCGEWVQEDTPARQRSRGWFWPFMIALLIAVILVLWTGLR